MRLSLPKSELQQGLGRLQAIVEKRNSMPILANALLTASGKGKDGRLEIAATDLEVGIRGHHGAAVSQPGALTVSARKLFEIVRELPDEEVQLRSTENSYLEFQCARSRFQLAGTSAEEFPSLPEIEPGRLGTFQAAVLSTMIDRTMYAASTDETRYNLNGVYFEVNEEDGRVRMVSTDGHRLALVDRVVGDGAGGMASGVILPRKALAELKRLVDEEDADEIQIGFEGNSALARKGDVTLVMRLIEGEFPNYQQVMPKASKHRVVVPAEPLIHAVRRVSLLSADRSRAIRVDFEPGKLSVSSNNPDLGEAHEELDLDYQGDPIAIGFNARYLLDCLGAFRSKEVDFGFDDELSPALLKPTEDPESLAVIMPMRL